MEKEISFEDLELGQHLWVKVDNVYLLMVSKINDSGYEVCGPWEGGIGKQRCEIIELVDFPVGFNKEDLYYQGDMK